MLMIHPYQAIQHEQRMRIYQSLLDVFTQRLIQYDKAVSQAQSKSIFETQNNVLDANDALKAAEKLSVAIVKLNTMKELMKHFIFNNNYVTEVSSLDNPDASFEMFFDSLESMICMPNQMPSEMSQAQVLEMVAQTQVIYELQKFVRRPLDTIVFSNS